MSEYKSNVCSKPNTEDTLNSIVANNLANWIFERLELPGPKPQSISLTLAFYSQTAQKSTLSPLCGILSFFSWFAGVLAHGSRKSILFVVYADFGENHQHHISHWPTLSFVESFDCCSYNEL